MHLPCVHSIWFTFIKHLKKNKMLVLPLANGKKNLTRYPRAHLTPISLRCPCYTNMKAYYALVETDSERVRVSWTMWCIRHRTGWLPWWKVSFSFKRSNFALFLTGINFVLVPMFFQRWGKKNESSRKWGIRGTISGRYFHSCIAFALSKTQTNYKAEKGGIYILIVPHGT